MTGVFNANLHDLVYEVIQKPLTGLGSSLPATLIALFFVQFLWFFGLHGQIIVNSVMDPIWNTLMLDNLEAYQHGKELPHIITKPFMETFTVGIGGSGMTLAVVLLMAFVLKKKQYRDVGRLALAPGIFNVNEPAIFGLPIRIERNHFDSLGRCSFGRDDVQLLDDGSWHRSSAYWCFSSVDCADHC